MVGKLDKGGNGVVAKAYSTSGAATAQNAGGACTRDGDFAILCIQNPSAFVICMGRVYNDAVWTPRRTLVSRKMSLKWVLDSHAR